MEEVEVVVDLSRTGDCFGVLADSFFARVAGRGLAPTAILPVELRRASEVPQSSAYVGCISESSISALVSSTTLSRRASSALKQGQLSLAPSFARDLGLRDGDIASILVASRDCQQASTVLVAPASVDDSEVVELNALRIEATLLQYVRIVFRGMHVTVPVYTGVTARVVVTSITVGAQRADAVFASLCEGTELHVATKPRASHQASSNQVVPSCASLRLCRLPESLCSSMTESKQACVSAATALRYGWVSCEKEKKLSIGMLHCAQLACITSGANANTTDIQHLEPSHIREHACKVDLCVLDCSSLLEDNCLYVPWTSSSRVFVSGNVLVTPAVPDNVALTLDAFLDQLSLLPGAPPAQLVRPLSDLAAVHGAVPEELAQLLQFVGSPAPTPLLSLHRPNILLSGPNGVGKSTIAASAAVACGKGASTVFVRYLPCADSKSFLQTLSTIVTECLLNAPSVIILDGIDKVAPADGGEGHVAAMSLATQHALEQVTYLRQVPSLAGAFYLQPSGAGCSIRDGAVMCLAIAPHRDSVNSCLRASRCFGAVVRMEPPMSAKRLVMLRQELGRCDTLCAAIDRSGALRKLLTQRMENFMPFDVVVFARRLRHAFASAQLKSSEVGADDENAVDTVAREAVERAAQAFRSLAQQGASQVAPAGSSERPITWDDVGGLAEVKKVLYDTLVLPSKMPKLFAKLPLKARSGVLLFGPSGCGKTYALQTIIAAEKLNCIVVNGPEIFGKYIGQSEQRIRDIFERAQAAAPSVVFFDEFDSVAPQRGHDNTGVTDRVVNQLLCYLDGVEARKNVFVVAASSRPDLIDAALLRPGRLDKAVYCPFPSSDERQEILAAHLKNVSHAVSAQDVADIAHQTEGWTSADLAALVSTANLVVVQRSLDMTRELQKLNLGAAADSADISSRCAVVQASAGMKSKITEHFDAIVAKNVSHLTAAPCPLSQGPTSVQSLITPDVLKQALAKSARSLSDSDIARQRAFYHRFIASREPGGSAGSPLVKPGTRQTMS